MRFLLLLVAMPGAPLVASLLLVAMPFAPSSVLFQSLRRDRRTDFLRLADALKKSWEEVHREEGAREEKLTWNRISYNSYNLHHFQAQASSWAPEKAKAHHFETDMTHGHIWPRGTICCLEVLSTSVSCCEVVCAGECSRFSLRHL